MLAFVPQDIKAISSTGFDAYIINDSNYTLSFAYLCAEVIIGVCGVGELCSEY